MAKLRGPGFSLDASGKLGNTVVFSKWRGINYLRALVTPSNPKTTAQVNVRTLLSDASKAWKNNGTDGTTTIDAAYKAAYKTAASGTQKSGFDLYIHDAVKKNGGSSYDGSLAIPTGPGDETA